MADLIIYGSGSEECPISTTVGVDGGGRIIARLLEKYGFLSTLPWDAEGGDEKPSGCLVFGLSGLYFAIVDSEDNLIEQSENINKLGKKFYEMALARVE